MRIGLLSDTHSYWDQDIEVYCQGCDEIWHAGDIGNMEVLDKIEAYKPTKAVYGNIDGAEVRRATSEYIYEEMMGVRLLMMHIGGYPGRYAQRALELIRHYKPSLFVCGHSHILRIMYDKKYQMLTVNPGAYGKHGFHQKRTMLRFDIVPDKVASMEIIELGTR